MRRVQLALGAALALSGCATGQRGFFAQEEQVALNIPAPRTDRCAKFAKASPEAQSCQQFKQQAVDWVRKLSPGDQFCLDNAFGDDPGGSCKARAVLLDSSTEGFLLEVRDARLDSKWVPYNQKHVWFASGAVIDQWLKEKGYE